MRPFETRGGDNVPLAPILEHHPGIRTLIVVRCNSAAVEPEPLRAGTRPEVRVVEVRPRTTLRGIFGELPELLPDGPVARRLQVWSGTFAFDREYAERFMQQGYRDGMAALRGLRPRMRLEW